MVIIPAIDLKDGCCVRLAQGQRDTAKVYHQAPVAVAKEFVLLGARLLHIVDLDAAFGNNNSANQKALKAILDQVDVPIQFGGGVRSLEDVRRAIDSGVSRIVVGTVAAESSEQLREMVVNFGSKVCVAIDAVNGNVLVRGWEKPTDVTALQLAKTVAEAGVRRIVFTDTQCDGMLNGPNIEHTVAIARQSGLKVTASGGISSLDDIRRLHDVDEPLIDSVIVGKALYEKKFTLAEAFAALQS
jgi:phosphoribosylformimino-5-aminoimidazole carboxamide ribotide isomerase